MKKENTKINWFGNPIKRNIKTKSKFNSNTVSYLGLGPKKVPSKVNFFGLGQKKRYKMAPASMFRKESIKKKMLSKYGDADMDGSPNCFDCSPRKAFKDAVEDKDGNRPRIEDDNYAQSVIDYATRVDKSRKKRNKQTLDYTKRNIRENKSNKGLKGLRKKLRIYSGKELKEVPEAKEKKQFRKELEEQKDLLLQLEPGTPAYKQLEADVQKREEKQKTYEEVTAKVREGAEKKLEMLKMPRLAGRLAYTKSEVEEAIAAGKKPTKKQLTALVKAQEAASLKTKAKAVVDKIPLVGGVGQVMTGAGIDKSGEYSRALRAKSARVRRMTSFAAGALFGPSLTRTHFDSEPRGRGRPPGPSGEYKIGGRPVYESDFQQYSAKQNALNRMLPSEQQSATLNPEYIAYMKAQKAAERGETQTAMTEEGMPMEGEVSEDQAGYPTMGTSMMQTGQQQIEIQQRRAYNRATPDEVKTAQYMAQSRDNILMAPNFMKGELKAAGGSILTPIGPSILEAPNAFKGEMRNVTQQNPNQGEVKVGDRPQVNPYGDEWLDIEIGSGKPVIRKRIREKWATGEAL